MSSLSERLELVVSAHDRLPVVLTELVSEADGQWAALDVPHVYGWRVLTALYCLPLAEPLWQDRYRPAEVLAILRDQVRMLVLERILDDVRDERVDAGALASAAWSAARAIPMTRVSAPGHSQADAGGAGRARALFAVPSGVLDGRHDAWLRGFSSLAELTVLLDDEEDAAIDLAAGRRTSVTAILQEERWTPGDARAYARVAARLSNAKEAAFAPIAELTVSYPMLVALAIAASPATARRVGVDDAGVPPLRAEVTDSDWANRIPDCI